MESSKKISNKTKLKIANYQQRGGWDQRERQVRAVNGEISIYVHTQNLLHPLTMQRWKPTS
jgi:hypothetical protein